MAKYFVLKKVNKKYKYGNTGILVEYEQDTKSPLKIVN
jgi:hypothetical protein